MVSRPNAASRADQTGRTDADDRRERPNRGERTARADRAGGVDPLAVGFATGTAWAVAVGALGLMAKVGWGKRWRALLSDVYVGFEPGEGSATAGVAWGFVDGFLGGALVGWFYNRFDERLPDARERSGW